jgi:hypothetical protein
MAITTTLTRIRKHGPCADGWEKLLTGLGKTRADDELLPYARIVEINGLDDALWCCRAEPQHAQEWRLYAIWCARRALASIPAPDQRSVAACDVAERHARGEASDAELDAAWAAAWAAARAARAAAWAASDAAIGAASAAAIGAASAAARDARDAASAAQRQEFLRIVGGEG